MADLRIKRRHLPHWELRGSTYFITFRVMAGSLSREEVRLVLDHIKSADGRFYTLVAATVLPDHTHLLLEPAEGVDLSRIMKGTKGASARAINKARGQSGSIWQDESFDRIVRDQAELDEKLNYMLWNAVKRALVEDPLEYEGWFVNRDALEAR